MYVVGNRRSQYWQRLLGVAAALFLHIGLALPALIREPQLETADEYAGAVLIELLPVPVASVTDAPSSMAASETAAATASVNQPLEETKPQEVSNAPVLPQSDAVPDDPELRMQIASPETKPAAIEPERALPTESKSEDTAPAAAASQAEAAQAPNVSADNKSDQAAAQQAGLSAKALQQAVESWQRSIVTAIAQNRSYPQLARERRIEGTTLIRFTLDRYGRLIAKSVEKPSSYEVLDKAALATLERTHEFPTPPKGITGEQFEFVIPVKFNVLQK